MSPETHQAAASAALPSLAARDADAPDSVPMQRVELIFIWCFWVFIALLTFVNSLVNSSSADGAGIWLPAVAPLMSALFKYTLWAMLTPYIFRLAGRYRFERRDWIAQLLILVAVGMVVAACITTVMDYVRYAQAEYFTAGLSVVRLLDLTQINWRFWAVNEFVVYLLILMAGYAHDYFFRYRTRNEQASAFQAQAAHLRAELADSRLNALRTQLNPHFLFNTLNAVSTLVDADPPGAQRMIAQLSDLLRDTLDGTDLEVPLQRELVFVRRYINIMQTRFQDRLRAVEVIAPETLNALVPSLILQPLVENAIKHGIDQLHGIGQIEIRAQRSGGQLLLSVADNGVAAPVREPGQEGGGLGIRNTEARLAQSYGEQQSFSLRTRAEGGVIAEIVLPFHTEHHAAAIPV